MNYRTLIFFVLSFCFSHALLAQPTDTQALLDQARSLQGDITQIAAEAESVEGERRESLELRNTERYLELLRLYDSLSAKLAEQKSRQQPIDQALAQISGDLLNVGPVISRAINRRQAVLDKLDQQFTPLSPEWQGAFREQQQFIDQALQALAKHVTNLNSLDLNSEQSSGFLHAALPQRAEVLSGIISLTQKDLQTTEQHLTNAPDDADALTKSRQLQEKLTTVTDSLRHTVVLLEARNLDASRYKELLIRTTGDITTDILDASLIKRLGQAWLDKTFTYVSENGIAFFFKLVIFIAILALFHTLSKAVRKLLKKSLRKATVPVSSLMEDMLVSLASRLVMLVGILVALGQLGFSLGPILAGLGVAGFIVGFALQDTLGNFASGMMILIYRPYDVGDLIEAAGVQGRVQRMNLVSTTILTIDNQTLMIPNNKIWGDVIRNVTAQKHRRIDMVFGIGYSDDIDHAERVLSAIVAEHPLVLDEPEPVVKLHTLNESSVDFVVRPWVETDHYWDVYWDITRAVKKRFDAEGISIPFPQRDVHVYQVKADN